ncbi:MAG: 16S rRNA (cytosine(1402)-N(4))-methyltransferase RsmH [Propionibacteriaceae bacterium]|jgi:16S rRNA (cytosine1402-N4)-methyltransferase|nr:16S rRNA (cytosine(1402)-N(4))-methyltransferase RsmH [Propionibacteriaceae bacterium]
MTTHVPVMVDEVLTLLAPALERPGAILVDCTLGAGGHSFEALTRFPGLRLLGIDRDPHAMDLARDRLAPFGDSVRTFLGRYDQLPEALGVWDVRHVAAVLFDLGLSSMQIDDSERGFAYSVDAPLTMRMDSDDSELTAADVVNTYSVQDLARILRMYADESHAARIARAIVAAREQEPFTRSARLVEVIASAIPAAARGGGHPAKKTFQAVRTEVNSERASLEAALPQALAAIDVGGRIAVLSYHSGEDRLVKRAFAEAASDHVPPGVAVVPQNLTARFRLLTRGADIPDSAEVATNPRAASAKLRGIERTKEEA